MDRSSVRVSPLWLAPFLALGESFPLFNPAFARNTQAILTFGSRDFVSCRAVSGPDLKHKQDFKLAYGQPVLVDG